MFKVELLNLHYFSSWFVQFICSIDLDLEWHEFRPHRVILACILPRQDKTRPPRAVCKKEVRPRGSLATTDTKLK